MKHLYLPVLLLLLTVTAAAQTSDDSSTLSVLQKKWQINAVRTYQSVPNTDPFRANNDFNQRLRDQKDANNANEYQFRNNLPVEAARPRFNNADVLRRNENKLLYLYQIKLRNNGEKTIKRVVWDYVFFDSQTGEEVGKRRFTSDTDLKPLDTDKIIVSDNIAPIRVIKVVNSGKNPPARYREEVSIKSIEYSDGTIWQAGDSK